MTIAPEHALSSNLLAVIFPFPPNLMYVILTAEKLETYEGPFDRLLHLARSLSFDSFNAHLRFMCHFCLHKPASKLDQSTILHCLRSGY